MVLHPDPLSATMLFTSFRSRELIAWSTTALSFGSLYYIFYVYARAPRTPPPAPLTIAHLLEEETRARQLR